MARKKRRSSSVTKSRRLRRLFAEQDGKCHYCKGQMLLDVGQDHPSRATIDHKIPTARGGSNRSENVVAACFACNNLKGRLTDEEFINAFPQGVNRGALIPVAMRRLGSAKELRVEQVKPPLPEALAFLDDHKGIVVQELTNNDHYRVLLPNGAEYQIYTITGTWTRIGSFVWTKGFRAMPMFRKEIERMMELMPMLLREVNGV